MFCKSEQTNPLVRETRSHIRLWFRWLVGRASALRKHVRASRGRAASPNHFSKCSSSVFWEQLCHQLLSRMRGCEDARGWEKRAINRWHRGGGGIPILDLRSRRRGQWVMLYPAPDTVPDTELPSSCSWPTICACECRYLEAPHKMRLV